MKSRWSLLTVTLFLLCVVTNAAAQNVLLESDFEDDDGGWVTLDPDAELGLTADVENVFSGTSSLEFSFTQRLVTNMEEGLPGALVLPFEVGLPGLQSLSFAIRTATTIPLFIGMEETDGSNYVAIVHCTDGQWNELKLNLSDFTLNTDDSSDENGQLDPDQITGLALVDASFFLQMLGDASLPLDVTPLGEQTIWLDAVILSDAPAVPADEPETELEQGERAVAIDACNSPAFRWLVCGSGVSATLDPDYAVTGGCYRLDYQVPAGKVFFVMRPLAVGLLAGTRALKLWVASGSAGAIYVAVEEQDGSRYGALIPLTDPMEWQQVKIDFAAFEASPDSQDENGRLDPEQIKNFAITDLRSILMGTSIENTLWIDDICAVGPEAF